MKRLRLPLMIVGALACASTFARAHDGPRRLTDSEARFLARSARCLQFMGDDGAAGDNVDASYGRDLAAALRSAPDSVARLRVACERRANETQRKLDLARYRRAK